MSKISDSRKALGVGKDADLNTLKTVYRNFMKENHPDKFQDEVERIDAEERSKVLIEAYHFLVSIAPETTVRNESEYQETIGQAQVMNFNYTKQTLTLDFSDGKSFEYFEVNRDVYNKFLNSDSKTRFARRRICKDFTYREVNQALVV